VERHSVFLNFAASPPIRNIDQAKDGLSLKPTIEQADPKMEDLATYRLDASNTRRKVEVASNSKTESLSVENSTNAKYAENKRREGG
jgi:hypothetical protein